MELLIDLAEETRQWLRRYLAGEIPLRTFEDWFVPMTWQSEASDDPTVRDLMAEIELALAEYSSGHWTEAELREKLRLLLGRAATIGQPTQIVAGPALFSVTAFGVIHFSTVVFNNEPAPSEKEREKAPAFPLLGGSTAQTVIHSSPA